MSTELPVVQPHRCAFPPPSRVWFRTEEGWGSREWDERELAEYAREVLGQ